VFENRVMRIFGLKRDEVTESSKKLHNEEVHSLFVMRYYQGDQIKECEMGRTCRTHEMEMNTVL
jgi:hypothetical protein